VDQPLRVLIVDDDEYIRELLRLVLDPAGAEIVGEAADGAQAVALTKELTPDVVIMDLAMPVMDGAQATRAILDHAPRTAVFGFTAYGNTEAKRLLDAGATGVFQKTSIRKLLELITDMTD
jgi:chemotaxis response regulator CheB